MSSYHKPKTYRSTEGCCICKAKSSSSRFTDSDKYEDEFENCFLLESEERTGDICNACVLIVKRWRQLPPGTSKNWAHVVDARAGPGHNTKKMMVPIVLKPSVKKRLLEEVDEERSPKILKKVNKKKTLLTKLEARVTKVERSKARRKNPEGVRRRRLSGDKRMVTTCTSGFIDFGYWRRMESCCGSVFVGQLGEVMVEQSAYMPCAAHNPNLKDTAAHNPNLKDTAAHNPNLANLAETAAKAEKLKAPIATSCFVPSVSSSNPLDMMDSDKSFIDEDEEDTDSMSFYSDTDSSVSKTSKNDLAAHTDDEGFEGLYDKTFKKNVRIKEMFGTI